MKTIPNSRSSAVKLRIILFTVVTTLISSTVSHAGFQTWNAGVNSTWDTATANWSGSNWTNNNDAVFGGSGVGTVTISAGVSANSLTFNASGYTIAGANLTLTGSADIAANSNATISSNIFGSAGLVKDGAGTLTLSGGDYTNYSGGTTVNAGTLVAGNQMPHYATVVINANGTFQAAVDNAVYFDALNINGGSFQTVAGSSSQNLGNITFTNGGSITTPGGGAWINAEFELNGNVTVVSGSATLAATHGFHLDGAGNLNSFNVATGSQLMVSGNLQGWSSSANIAKTGGGLMILSGSSSYTGSTTINSGTLQAGVATSAFGVNSAVTLANAAGATLATNGYSNTIGSLSGGGTAGGSVAVYGDILTVGSDNTSTTYAGSISDANWSCVTLNKVGTGKLTLTGSNSLTMYGQLSVSGGVLELAYGSSLYQTGWGGAFINTGGTLLLHDWGYGSHDGFGGLAGMGAITINGGTIEEAGAVAYIGAVIGNRTFSIGANGATLQSDAGVLWEIGNAWNFILANNSSLILSGSGNGQLDPQITGTGTLTMNGSGAWTLTGSNNYTGATVVNSGTLGLASGSYNAAAMTVASGAALSVSGPVSMSQLPTMAAGSILNFGLGLIGSSGNIQITGTYAAPSSPVTISISDLGTNLNSGTYNLITGAAGISASSFVVNSTLSTPGVYALSATNGTLSLAVALSASIPTSALGASGTFGSVFSYQIALVSNPTGFGATGLPPGVTLNAGTGLISGTPSAPGTYFTTITSSCAGGTASSQLIIVVPPPPGTPLLTGSNAPQVVFDSGTSLTIQPWLDNTLLINPGKGYVEYSSIPTKYTNENVSVGYLHMGWSDLEPSEGVYDWSSIEDRIAAYAQYGRKIALVVLNFSTGRRYTTPKWVFDAGAVPLAVPDPSSPTGDTYLLANWEDPVYLAKMKDFIAAFGARYNGNPNISQIFIANYGMDGEGSYGGPSISPESLKTNYLAPYFQAFPNTQLFVNGPDLVYQDTFAWAVRQGAGRNTGGICSGVGNGSMCLISYPDHPAHMEYYGLPISVYRGGAENELMIYLTGGRPSYLQFNGDGLFDSDKAFYQMVGNLIGYHFVLEQATIPKTITAGVQFPLSFTWYNNGVAPLNLLGSAPCSVAVALLDADNNPVQKQWLTASNPKGWMPGTATTENFNVTFPSVPSGYKLAVGLFLSQSDANPAFRLGIQGRTNNGWYLLSGTTLQAAAKWTNASGGSWQTSGNWAGNSYRNGPDAAVDFSTLNLTSDATATLDGNVTVGSLVFGDTTPSNNWLLTSGTLTLRTSTGGPVITVNNQTATIGAALIANNGFTKSGSGTLVLSNTNDVVYGSVTVNGGVLDITASQLYTNGTWGPSPPAGLLTVNSGATLRLYNWGQWYTRNLGMLDTSGSSVVVNGGTIEMANPSYNWDARNFTIGALGATLSVSQAGGNWELYAGASPLTNNSSLTLTGSGGGTIDMPITGTGSLTKNGSGVWILTAANTYTGATVINGGLLYLNAATATLGSGSSAVTLANVAGATLETFWWNGTTNIGTSFSIGSLAGGGALGGNVILGQTATMTVGTDNTSTTYAGVISDLGGPGNVAKVGTGVWTLTGANTYTGTTTVSAGKIVLSGTIASTSSVSIAAGAQVTVSGKLYATGTIVNSGTLIFTGSAQFGAGGTITNNGVIINSSPSLTLPTIVNNGTIYNIPAAPTGIVATPGNAQVSLTWNAVSGAASYNVKQSTVSGTSYTVVGSPTSPAFTATGLTNGTTYYFVISAVNPAGEGANSAQKTAGPNGLPSPWTKLDIGTVGITGSATYLSGTYTVMGGGAGITSSADAFCYTYQTSSSDCSVVARVASITNTNASAKGGVMIRNTTAANSMEAGIWVTPSSGIIFTYRKTTGGTTSTSSSTGKTAPYWVKITRTGNSFAGYYSANGTSWTQLGSTQTISMGTSATIGLGDTSNVAGTLCTSKIDNVTATP